MLCEHRTVSANNDHSEHVFPNSRGKMLDRHNVRRRGHQPAVRAAGLSPALRLHDLRHSAASLWLAAGESSISAKPNSGTPTSRPASTSTAIGINANTA
jgi:site-specific recombinase XerD